MINRRSLITGLISLIAAPAIVRAGSLMPVKAMRPMTVQWMDSVSFADWQVTVDHGIASMWTRGIAWNLNDPFTLFWHTFEVDTIMGSAPGWVKVTGVCHGQD